MHTLVKSFKEAEDGATAIEYGLIAALISLAIIGALGLVNQSMTDMYELIRSSILGAISG